MAEWTILGLLLVFCAGAWALEGIQPAYIEDVQGNSPTTRIVSGWVTPEGAMPFQIQLRMIASTGQVSSCGGSIIHNEWGLTAAHCSSSRITIVVRVGAVNLTTPENIFETTEYYNYPTWDPAISAVQLHDIALLKFPRRVEYSDRIQPIRLQSSADKDRNYNGVQMVASGWGITWTSGSGPENMNWVYMLGDSNEHCNTYYTSSIIQDSTICASYYNVTSQSTCSGDSGGILSIAEQDGEITQIGVTCFVSSTGCHTGYPAGFVRPGHYHDWFTEVTGINFDWERDSESTASLPPTPAPPSIIDN